MDEHTLPGGSREELIADTLAEVSRMLDRTPETPQTRALRAQARSYDLAVKRWATFPPTYAQVDAMFEVVTELHGKVTKAGASRSSA